jgi:hypothetical protein
VNVGVNPHRGKTIKFRLSLLGRTSGLPSHSTRVHLSTVKIGDVEQRQSSSENGSLTNIRAKLQITARQVAMAPASEEGRQRKGSRGYSNGDLTGVLGEGLSRLGSGWVGLGWAVHGQARKVLVAASSKPVEEYRDES